MLFCMYIYVFLLFWTKFFGNYGELYVNFDLNN